MRENVGERERGINFEQDVDDADALIIWAAFGSFAPSIDVQGAEISVF